MPVKLNNKIFIEKSKLIHGDKYDYSLVDYKGTSIKVKIICPKHGIFEQSPNCHLRKRRCPICFGNQKYTNKSFIEKCENIYGKTYDYSLVDYKNNKIKVKIICKKHGIFEQRPDMFIQGHGCSKCNEKEKLNTYEFIKRSIKTHGNKYDYTLTDYELLRH